jgi:cell division protein FtsZ
VDFICVNTDAQALKHSQREDALQIGCNITKGLGAGANPEVGRQAAMEDRDRMIEADRGLRHAVHHRRHGRRHRHRRRAGRGAGREGARHPDGRRRDQALRAWKAASASTAADHGIAELSKYVDSLITIPNQKLLTVLGKQTTLLDAFKAANRCCRARCRASPS